MYSVMDYNQTETLHDNSSKVCDISEKKSNSDLRDVTDTINYLLENVTDDTSSDSHVCIYDFKTAPVKIIDSKKDYCQTLESNNFTKGCKWSPDGLCVLTNSDDNALRLFNTPGNYLTKTVEEVAEMGAVLVVKESGTIYDFCWYPPMNSSHPDTCCFASSCRLGPIHMWDAYTGELRCTYKAYNHVDQLVSAYSLAFNEDGQKLYSGFNKTIRIFDVAIPGRSCIERSLKKSSLGIISCIAVNPSDSNVYAAGSYSRAVGIFDELSGQQIFTLQGQNGGITQLMFSSCGEQVFTGGRKDSEILCWDLRNPGEILYVLEREVDTNQRIYFDIDKSGRYLISGNTNGLVSVWDIQNAKIQTENNSKHLKPHLHFVASFDCVNGISLNSVFPIIATTSGQRKFPSVIDNCSDDDEEAIFSNDFTFDNSLTLWHAAAPYKQ